MKRKDYLLGVLMTLIPLISFIHLCALAIWHLAVAVIVLYVVVQLWLGCLGCKRWKTSSHRGVLVCMALYSCLSTILLGLVIAFTFRYQLYTLNFELVQTALGSVSEQSITIWTRDPHAGSFFVQYKEIGDKNWSLSASTILPSSTDYTGVVRLTGLRVQTSYDYQTIRHDSTLISQGTFHTLPSSGQITFAFGSCFMVGRTFSRKLNGLTRFQDTSALDFYLMLGDSIYADIPWLSIGFGSHMDYYRSSYRETLSVVELARLRAAVPGFYQIDDHEFLNDFNQVNSTDIFITGQKIWSDYLGQANPVSEDKFYNFTAGKASFFVFDTRSHRPLALLGDKQMASVKQWLISAQTLGFAFKFLTSPQAVTRNFQSASEGWVNFPQEREELLDFIQEHNITGCIFLSGDLHQAGVYELRPGLYEFSVSPIDASGQVSDYTPYSRDKEVFKSYLHNFAFGVVQLDDRDMAPVVIFRIYQSGGNLILEIARILSGTLLCVAVLLTLRMFGSLRDSRVKPESVIMHKKAESENLTSFQSNPEDSGADTNQIQEPLSPQSNPNSQLRKSFVVALAGSGAMFVLFTALLTAPERESLFAAKLDTFGTLQVLSE